MPKIYYLFSKNERREPVESVYFCKDEDFIDNPTLKTGIYPMGTLLSKTIRILTPWFESDLFSSGDKLINEFKKFAEKDSSFSNIVCDDSIVYIFLDNLLSTSKNTVLKEHDKRIEILELYMEYIALCQKKKKIIPINKLESFSEKIDNEFLKKPSRDAINELLVNSGLPGQPFTPTIREDFFNKSLQMKDTTPWGSLTIPISVFNIYDVVDFILATLQCVFEQAYFMGKCNYCGNLFVNYRQVKYCPKQDQDPDSKIISCQEKASNKEQTKREKASESRQLHKRISDMLNSRIGTVADYDEPKIRLEEYEAFKAITKKYRKLIREGKMTEEEYVIWMKQYREDIKEKTKIRLNRNKKTKKNKK